MKITVIAKTNARHESVSKLVPSDREIYTVSVKESPIDGKANTAIAKALARHFNVAPSTVELVIGASSKIKVFEI